MNSYTLPEYGNVIFVSSARKAIPGGFYENVSQIFRTEKAAKRWIHQLMIDYPIITWQVSQIR